MIEMRLRRNADGVLVYDQPRNRWVSVPAAIRATGGDRDTWAGAERDVLAFLHGGADTRQQAERLLAEVADADADADATKADNALRGLIADPDTAGLPFIPRSLRAFMLWEAHVIASSRMLVKHFYPPAAWRVVETFERVTGKTFPKLKPNQRFWDAPTFYVAAHTMVLADGEEMWMPTHTQYLDFELELAFVLSHPLVDPTPEEALGAVGGWLVLNDWSARDVQAQDARSNVFGPVVKSKTFANSIGCDVVTADAFGDWTRATGRVRVDGEVWCEGATADPAHGLGAMLAYAAQGERLDVGDVISTGTMPGCCGLELERWIAPGQTIELEIDGIGTVRNRLSADARPTTAVPAPWAATATS